MSKCGLHTVYVHLSISDKKNIASQNTRTYLEFRSFLTGIFCKPVNIPTITYNNIISKHFKFRSKLSRLNESGFVTFHSFARIYIYIYILYSYSTTTTTSKYYSMLCSLDIQIFL